MIVSVLGECPYHNAFGEASWEKRHVAERKQESKVFCFVWVKLPYWIFFFHPCYYLSAFKEVKNSSNARSTIVSGYEGNSFVSSVSVRSVLLSSGTTFYGIIYKISFSLSFFFFHFLPTKFKSHGARILNCKFWSFKCRTLFLFLKE